MSVHAKLLRLIGELGNPRSREKEVAEAAAAHIEACEKLLAAYYASHNGKFGPCDCEAFGEYRKVRVE